MAALARGTDSEPARKEAQARLGTAVRDLAPVYQARAISLSLAQLTALHFEAGELDEGVAHGHRLLDTARGIRSSRLAEHLAVVRRAAATFAHELRVKDLVADWEARLPCERAS